MFFFPVFKELFVYLKSRVFRGEGEGEREGEREGGERGEGGEREKEGEGRGEGGKGEREGSSIPWFTPQ